VNQSELCRLLTVVANDFATTLGVDPERLAQEAAKRTPDSFAGDPAREFRRACETTSRLVEGGRRFERPGAHVISVFKRLVFAGDGPTTPSASSTDPFVQQLVREIDEEDAKIRAMPKSRHDAVRAIEAWRNDRSLPTPHWALNGFESREEWQRRRDEAAAKRAAERAERGLMPPAPPGPTSVEALVHKHNQRLADISADLAEAGED